MRILIAARLSRRKGDGSQTGMESQDTEILKWAEREGHEIIHIAADFKSGTTHPWDRKNLRPWVTEPSKIAQYDAVVAYRFDRLSRGDDRSTSMIEEWAYQNGKQLLTEDGLRFPCEGADGIRWDVTKRIAHEEWLKISERYNRMTLYLRSEGYHIGRSHYGYRAIILDGHRHKRLVIDPKEAAVVRDMAAWCLDGASLADIAARLNEAGRLPRKMGNGYQGKWHDGTVGRVLRNEVIAGRQKDSKGRTIQKIDEPILSRATWEKVIRQLSDRSKRKGLSPSKHPALLTSIIICTACGKPMYRSGTARNRYYYCSKTKGCGSIIRIDIADKFIHDAMSSDHRRDMIEVVIPGSGYEAEIAEIKRDMAEAVEAEEFEQLAGLKAELDRLRSLPASPTRIERRESDQTVAQMWAAMTDDTARRKYLLERYARVEFGRDEHGGTWLISNLGQPQS